MQKVGDHITLDFIGVSKEYTSLFYEEVMNKIAKAAKVGIINIAKYEFSPKGLTIIALLKESHISFHTFPEDQIISFDFFTCGQIHPDVAVDILKNEIEHTSVVYKKISRDSVHHYPDIYSSEGIQITYIVEEVIKRFTSKQGQFIEILKLKEYGNALFIDNEIQVAENDEELYSSTFVNSSLKLANSFYYAKNKSAAIIGGGDGGVVRECIKNGFNYVDWFELDQEVVEVCETYLPKVFKNINKNKNVNCIWGDAFENITSRDNEKYDHIFIDLNDDQYCISLAEKNMNEIKRIVKKNGVVTAQVGCKNLKPNQVESWINVLNNHFGNTTMSEIYIPSYDCSWNFVSSVNK